MTEVPGQQIESARQLPTKDLIDVLRSRFQANPLDPELTQGISSFHADIEEARKKAEATPTPKISPLVDTPTTPVETPDPNERIEKYLGEKIRASGEYDLSVYRFRPDWKIGGTTLSSLYPDYPKGTQEYLREGWLNGKGYDGDGTYGSSDLYQLELRMKDHGRKYACLLTTPQVRIDGLYTDSQKAVYKELFGKDYKQSDTLTTAERTAVLKHERRTKERKVDPHKKYSADDYISDRGETYFLYAHSLSSQSSGRGGERLLFPFKLSGEDSQKFIDTVHKDPHLIEKVFNEVFPGLLQDDQLSRDRVYHLLVATPIRGSGVDGRYERFDKLPLNPPMGDKPWTPPSR